MSDDLRRESGIEPLNTEDSEQLIEDFIQENRSSLCKIGGSKLRKSGDSLFIEPDDLINQAISENKFKSWYERWTKYPPQKRAPLKFWLLSKFDGFCYNVLCRKNFVHTLNYDPEQYRGDGRKALQAVSLDIAEHDCNSLQEDSFAEMIESLNEIQKQVLTKIYKEGKTLAEVAADLNTYEVKILRIRDAALKSLR